MESSQAVGITDLDDALRRHREGNKRLGLILDDYWFGHTDCE